MTLTPQEEHLLRLYAATTQENRTLKFYEKCMTLFYQQASVVRIRENESLKQIA